MNILEIPMQENDAKAKTIADYLRALLRQLWEEGESFSGKRPFGNSGWDHDLYVALVKAKAVKGELDEDGYIVECDERAANKAIFKAISNLK